MKRRIVVTVMCLAVLVSIPVLGAITGSAHDFQSKTWNSTNEICIVCHTPHNAKTGVAGAPLWNHEETATVTFTLYSSPTLDATPLGQPSGTSKLCLSCHDGTVPLDNFGDNTLGTEYVSGSADFGTNLGDDHPISFAYDDALATADGALHPPSTTNSGLGGTIAADLLIGGQLECSSCHDVHNKYTQSKLLVMSNTATALCLTCHDM